MKFPSTFVVPSPVTLRGHGVVLEPLRAEHAAEFLPITPPETFAYFLSWPAGWEVEPRVEAMRAWLEKLLANPKNVCFLVRDAATGAAVGSSSYMDIDPPNRALEIGATWYDPRVRGTHVNPACKLLLLHHALEELGCIRVTLKCDGRNVHSQRAIAKLGAVREGTLRKHRITQTGYERDTVYFSVTREEWGEVRGRLFSRAAKLPNC